MQTAQNKDSKKYMGRRRKGKPDTGKWKMEAIWYPGEHFTIHYPQKQAAYFEQPERPPFQDNILPAAFAYGNRVYFNGNL